MLFPMFAMVLLTAIVGLITVSCRVKSVKAGIVKIKYYRLMEGEAVPENITKTTRCFNNMFEAPVLFYVVASLYITLQIQNPVALTLAWMFVAFRCLQAFIHLTGNNVLHRMVVYWLSFGSMFMMWIVLIIDQLY